MRWNYEQKLKMVQDYLRDRTIPMVDHCTRASLVHSIRLWARAYTLHGPEALKHKKNHVFSKQMKINAIKRVLSGQSRNAVAIKLGVHPYTITEWYNKYQKEGFKGFKDNLPSMNHKYLDISNREEQDLNVTYNDLKYQKALKELRELKAENLYLKKLCALDLSK